MLLKMGELASDHTCYNVAHTVVISYLLVLIPGCVFSALCRPFSRFVCTLKVIGQKHSAAGACYDFISVKGNCVICTEGACLPALVGCAQGLSGVLYENSAVLITDCRYLVKLRRSSVKINNHNSLNVGVQLKCLLKRSGVHIPGLPLGVYEDWYSALINNGIYRGAEGDIRAEHLITLLDACQLHSQVQRGCACGKSYGILTAYLLTGKPFHLVYICADGGHPVSIIGFLYIFDFLAVHCR